MRRPRGNASRSRVGHVNNIQRLQTNSRESLQEIGEHMTTRSTSLNAFALSAQEGRTAEPLDILGARFW
jgi:hypothetical protein